MHNARVLLVIDLIGVFVFALAGATAAVRQRLDLFGVLVLSFATASAGGILRDLLIGAVPPAAFQDWRYFAAAMLAGLTHLHLVPTRSSACAIRCGCSTRWAWGCLPSRARRRRWHFGLHPVMAALLGMLTGIGGGVTRDLLLSRVPVVFQSDIYALAALAGAVVVVLGDWLQWAAMPTAIGGTLLCFGLRILAMWFHWHLPSAHHESRLTRTELLLSFGA